MRKLITKRKPRFYNRKLETGFSMLEAVVTVGVLLALAVAGFFAYGAITENARKAVVKTDASKLHTAALVANTDSESDTSTQGVLDEYNESTTVTQAAFLDASKNVIEGTFNPTLDQDFCVKVYYVEDPETFSINGNCTDPAPTDPGGGGGGTQPVYAESFQCGDETYGVTAAQVAGTDKSKWASYTWDRTKLYYNTYPITELTFTNTSGQVSNTGNYPARIQLIDASSAGTVICQTEYMIDGVYTKSDGPAFAQISNGITQREIWYTNGMSGLTHRVGGPADIQFYNNGDKYHEKWFINGQLHNDSGPAYKKYNGGVIQNDYYHLNGELYRTDNYMNGVRYQENWANSAGVLNNPNGPARVTYSLTNPDVMTFESWYVNNKLHRLDGPANVNRTDNGTVTLEEWYRDGIKHRDFNDGPAYTATNATTGSKTQERWTVDGVDRRLISRTASGVKTLDEWRNALGQFHRDNAPARQQWNTSGVKTYEWWYTNGVVTKSSNCAFAGACTYTGD